MILLLELGPSVQLTWIPVLLLCYASHPNVYPTTYEFQSGITLALTDMTSNIMISA